MDSLRCSWVIRVIVSPLLDNLIFIDRHTNYVFDYHFIHCDSMISACLLAIFFIIYLLCSMCVASSA